MSEKFKNFLKGLGFHFNGQWRLPIDSDYLTRNEIKINKDGGWAYGRNAADAVVTLAMRRGTELSVLAAQLLINAGVIGIQSNGWPVVPRKIGKKLGFSNFHASEDCTDIFMELT